MDAQRNTKEWAMKINIGFLQERWWEEIYPQFDNEVGICPVCKGIQIDKIEGENSYSWAEVYDHFRIFHEDLMLIWRLAYSGSHDNDDEFILDTDDPRQSRYKDEMVEGEMYSR